MTQGASAFIAFDAYGTLFDVHSAARHHAEALGEDWQRLSAIWRAKQLEYSWIHAGLGAHIPFRDATQQGLIFALRSLNLDEALAPSILERYATLDLFPEVQDVLAALKARRARLAILSNADPDMLDDLVDHAKIRGAFQSLISVKAAGTFKPNGRVYALGQEAFGVPANRITFVSSNRWDVAGARAAGLSPVWVNRSGAPDEYPHLPAERVVSDLRALLDD